MIRPGCDEAIFWYSLFQREKLFPVPAFSRLLPWLGFFPNPPVPSASCQTMVWHSSGSPFVIQTLSAPSRLSTVPPYPAKAVDVEAVTQSNTDIIIAHHFPHDFILILP